MQKRLTHYSDAYLINPQHPISIKVLGCGGTGSQMLQALARIHVSLMALGHPGFVVQAWDDDVVTDANLGRQLFSQSDIGQPKAKILIDRINRFYGISWYAYALKWVEDDLKNKAFANIMITCVDNVATRELMQRAKVNDKYNNREPFAKPLYWLDLGNSLQTGQVVLGTLQKIKQPTKMRNLVTELPTIIDLFPDLKKRESKDTTPSCSLWSPADLEDVPGIKDWISWCVCQLGNNEC